MLGNVTNDQVGVLPDLTTLVGFHLIKFLTRVDLPEPLDPRMAIREESDT